MKRLLVLVLILLVPLLLIRGWWNHELSAVSSDKTTHKVIIAKGKSVGEIADQLKSENLIRSTFAFKLFVRQSGLSSKISAGTFTLSPSMSVPKIVDILTGKPNEVWVTLIEGWRIEEIASKLNKELGVDEKEFIKLAKEGYMFPDTYLFPDDVTVGVVAQRLEDTFNGKYTDELKNKIRAQGLTDKEGVILASIVEREARSDKVRTEVASILLKRIKIGMGLNADATIQYALGYQASEKSWWKKSLTRDDLKVDSRYNTYLHRGLPPTPIANPGLASIKAIANADSSTSYLYYYHDSKGNSYYGKTLDEHNENVANHP